MQGRLCSDGSCTCIAVDTYKPPMWISDVSHQFNVHEHINSGLAIKKYTLWAYPFTLSLGIIPFIQKLVFFVLPRMRHSIPVMLAFTVSDGIISSSTPS